ncbi:hypothetical protein [Trinickia terrae]|uniref:hypothetical protein n=1 Tax=Trinickia terrae TaxID=2571161 RepID=UPI001F102A6B|nr:hypothetical protein [Trinickia terrae]
MLNNFTAASYDTHVRATGVGMELAVGRVGAILGPYLGGVLQQIHRGPQTTLLAIGIAAAGAAAIVLLARRTPVEPEAMVSLSTKPLVHS